MKAKEILENAYIGLAGNRVNLLSKAGIVASIYGMEKTDSLLIALPCFLGLEFSVVLFCYTTLGLSTLKYFKRTQKHIKKFGRLEERFAKELILGTENRKFTGYCQLQGMYFAAKKHGQLDTFYKVREEVSKNIIPNF